jgi:hypothetical protein
MMMTIMIIDYAWKEYSGAGRAPRYIAYLIKYKQHEKITETKIVA